MIDFYEFLQISPNADSDTIHRVYRFLAARFHPDNQKSGNAGMFNQLKMAYDVLSHPSRRAMYDSTRVQQPRQPLSYTIDFMDDLEGELNRRLAVLAVLYHRRRTSPNLPEISLAQLEERMGFPREYLDFTLWYLHKKGYILRADNAQFVLTAEGVDFVESERAKLPTLDRLLTSGTDAPPEAAVHSHAHTDEQLLSDVSAVDASDAPMVMNSTTMEPFSDRREGKKDRRVGAPDKRSFRVERRGHVPDRRSKPSWRKVN